MLKEKNKNPGFHSEPQIKSASKEQVFSMTQLHTQNSFFTAGINYQILYRAFNVLHKAMSLSSILEFTDFTASYCSSAAIMTVFKCYNEALCICNYQFLLPIHFKVFFTAVRSSHFPQVLFIHICLLWDNLSPNSQNITIISTHEL